MKELFENWKRYLTIDEQVESDSGKVSITLPKFRISEQWGEPGSEDRQIIEMFTSQIKGANLQEKIKSLQDFVIGCDEKCASTKDVSEILGSLVFLDALASVIYDFNDKTGGFLFESIVAALLGGSARQVPTPGGPNQPIEDLLDSDDTPLSLKFLFYGGNKKVGGSIRNANVAVEKYKQPIKYIVATKNRVHKTGEVLSIDFHIFTMGNKNYPGDYDIGWLGDLDLYRIRKFKVATLDMGSRSRLQELGQKYADRLGEVLIDIYKQIESLSLNVNKYFISSPEQKSAALDARDNANVLKKQTDDLI